MTPVQAATVSLRDETRIHRPENTSCRVCGNAQMRALYKAKGYEMAACDVCGFAQAVEQPSDDYLRDLYEALYAKHAAFRAESAAIKENRSRVAMVKKLVPRGATLLDAGCAAGDFLVEAQDDFQCYGVDISADAIAAAKARLPALADRLSTSRLEDIGQQWPLFDVVCMWDVIEHLWDPVTVVDDLMKLVKPGGYLFLSTPDFGAPTAKVMKANWAFMIPPYHLGLFSLRCFKWLFGHRVPGTIRLATSKGKWTNITFFFYKLNQISKLIAPQSLLDYLSRSRLGRINLYVPTGDIIYIAVQKPL